MSVDDLFQNEGGGGKGRHIGDSLSFNPLGELIYCHYYPTVLSISCSQRADHVYGDSVECKPRANELMLEPGDLWLFHIAVMTGGQ